MNVRARFYVTKTTNHAHNPDQTEVELRPVVRPTDDNIEWSKFTPSGEIKMTVTAPGAVEWFRDHLGKDVAITFAEVESLADE